MIITIASGKGGTGKTFVAVNLAVSLFSYEQSGEIQPLTFLDCDVEAPNAALFLQPKIYRKKNVEQYFPLIDFETCTGCGKCAQVCQYHAMAIINQKAFVFKDICHACGSCGLICPEQAIHDTPDKVGIVERGSVRGMEFANGMLDIGKLSPVPVIQELKKWMQGALQGEGTVIIDAPPGASCPVVESMRGADFVLLVTEPTPFGLHDLKAAVIIAKDELNLPVGVVINRDGIGDTGVKEYCQSNKIPILLKIPFDRKIAEIYSGGKILVEIIPEYKIEFQNLFIKIQRVMKRQQAFSNEEDSYS
ncbi:MAG TPA: P-loop NTPase [Anaerolineae bacterium]|nr:P-loop NTPase [Anaerolineae bacterium]